MKTAIISDIHANIEALEAVFADIESQEISSVICLGDIVGYGANPNECVELIRKKCPVTLMGNHDAAALNKLSTEHFNIHAKIAIDWTIKELTASSMAYLESLPVTIEQNDTSFVHATPYEPKMWYYITSLEEAAFNFQYFRSTKCLIGHTHIPIIIGFDGKREVFVHQENILNYAATPGSRYIINVGSVGQPRDRNPAACYGIIDEEAKTYSYRRVEYDIAKTQAKMKKIHMPEFLISRLKDGR
jgi:predicted phosphodiesterase